MTRILGIFIFILCKPNVIVYPAGFGRVFLFFLSGFVVSIMLGVFVF
jgi:hypothetical protein